LDTKKAIIKGALLSIRELSNQQLATMNLNVHADWPCASTGGYDKVSHLFNDDGKLIHPILKDAFVIEVNRRVDAGEFND
jgi:hypothetical protein